MRVKSRWYAVVLAGSYGKKFSVIQSSCTLREAMTKKGRCSVFRQRPFDVSATTGYCRGCRLC